MFERVPNAQLAVSTAAALAAATAPVNKLDQLERLKKLLDQVAPTQQELDREKAKVLNQQ